MDVQDVITSAAAAADEDGEEEEDTRECGTMTTDDGLFSIPMSQDCVVWNESRNTDLRSRQLPLQVPTTTTTTNPFSAFAMTQRVPTPITHFRRRPDMTNPPATAERIYRNPSNDQEVDSPSNDQEIEFIFGLLQNDNSNQILPNHDNSRAAHHPQSQHQGNHHNQHNHHNHDHGSTAAVFPKPMHTGRTQNPTTRSRHSYPPAKKGPTVAGQPHKSDRKRADSLGVIENSRQEKVAKVSEMILNAHNNQSLARSSSTISPVPGPRRGGGSHVKTGFEDLLNQVETPSPFDNGARKPDSECSTLSRIQEDPPPSTFKRLDPNLDASDSARDIQPTSLDSLAFKQPSTNMDKENLNANVVASKNILPAKAQLPMPSTTATCVRPPVLLRAPLQQKNPNTSTNSSTLVSSETKIRETENNHIATVDQKQNAPTVNNDFDDEFGDFEISEEDLAHIDTSAPTQTTTVVVQNEQADDASDEFGNFDLSEEDFAQVDTLVEATQRPDPSQQDSAAEPHSSNSDAETVGHDQAMDPRESDQAHHCSAQPLAETTHTISNANTACSTTNNEFDDDPFGDFPEIDYDALDKATHYTSNANTCSTTNNEFDDDPFGDFPEIDYDALDKKIATQQPLLTSIENPGCLVRNPRADSWDDETSYLSFSRYKVQKVEQNVATFTQTLFVQTWDSSMMQDVGKQAIHKPSSSDRAFAEKPQEKKNAIVSGLIILRGSYYFLDIQEEDVLHLCSLTGRYKTDPSALPIIIHSDPPNGSDHDDLVPILHPEMLAIPTTATETIECPRRAVLKNRLGSTVSSSKKLLLGTMRHELFEFALKQESLTMDVVQKQIRKILRKEAEKLVCCKMTSIEGERELNKFWPQVQAFKREYFRKEPINDNQLATLEGVGTQSGLRMSVASVKGVEQELTSHELGMKGNLDVLVEAVTSTMGMPQSKTLMSIELKTNHNTNPQGKHFAQLAFYTIMMLARNGHTASENTLMKRNPESSDPIAGGMLLYINNETKRAIHVAPQLGEIKCLVEQRNNYCSQVIRASKPRGVSLLYEDEESPPKIVVANAPPADLPDVQFASQCSRCFSARECMTYAASGSSVASESRNDVRVTHKQLLEQYTGHLSDEELEYFRTWDRLIDLEADATQHSVAEAWLEKSEFLERKGGNCISALTYLPATPQESSADDDSVAFIALQRSAGSTNKSPLSSLRLHSGSYVTCSTDCTTIEAGYRSVSSTRNGKRAFRHQTKVFRGVVESIEGDDKIVIRTSNDSIRRMNDLISLFRDSDPLPSPGGTELLFRLDHDDSYSLMGTLRRNVLDLLTKDKEPVDKDAGNADMKRLRMEKRFARHRQLIIKLQPPVFNATQSENMFHTRQDSKILPACDPMELMSEFATKMNRDQREAAQKVASMKDYSLIQGFPGSGKSSTIVFVARMLAAQGKRVLITSYTHSAVDNCLLKLMELGVADRSGNIPGSVIRIGAKTSVHPNVHDILVSQVAADLVASQPQAQEGGCLPSAESLRRVVSAARIVGATALTIPKSSLLVGEHFDVVIVDEAGQITQPALLGALAAADTFVLVGDHMQLPPLVSSECALQGGYGESMLKRLAEAHPNAVAPLTLQYRMHAEICAVASQAIYNGTLTCAREVPRLELPGWPKCLQDFGKSPAWVRDVINPFRPVVFADTDKIELAEHSSCDQDTIVPLERTASRQPGGNIVNEMEARLVGLLLQRLIACGVSPSSIGIICPFNSQIRYLKELQYIEQLKSDGLEINTIDKYQGRDKDIIIVSFVRSNKKGKVGRLLEDMRRINVAVTRAKQKMILLGSMSTLQKGSPTLKVILDQLKEQKRVVSLPPDTQEAWNIDLSTGV